MHENFLEKEIPAFGRKLFRLGIATNYGITGDDLAWAIDQGINYVYAPTTKKPVRESLKDILKEHRESICLATGPVLGYFGGSVTRACERALKTYDTDYIDLFQLHWLGRTSALTSATIDALLALKESGKVRAIGVSIHDRVRAGKLAEDSPLDALMIRYNAAHPGAERDIFPHLEVRNPAIIAYTATRWRGLLKPAKGWDGPVMTAADCYRFCLSDPNVAVTLTGPKNRQQLEENIKELKEKGPLTEEENKWMREFGQVVHQSSSRFTFGF